MKKLAVAIVVFTAMSNVAFGGADFNFATERGKRITRVQLYDEAAKGLLIPGYYPKGTCQEQIKNLPLYSRVPAEGAVFAFRVPIALASVYSPTDARIAIAFDRLTELTPYLRQNIDKFTYCLPGRSDQTLAENEVYDSELAPNHLTYAARAYLQFPQNAAAKDRAYALWKTIHEKYQGSKGGIVSGWNPKTDVKSDVITQASLIYPWSSSGFKLLRNLGESDFRRNHLNLLESSTAVALKMIREGKLPVEQLTASTLEPLNIPGYGEKTPVVILGHYAQILNFLMRSHAVIPNSDIPDAVTKQFKFLLEGKFINRTVGGIGNGYYQETGEPVTNWGTNMAYWQLCELAAALDRGIKTGLIRDPAVVELAKTTFLKTIDALALYFEAGIPRRAYINAQGEPLDEDTQFIAYILPYHTADLLDQLRE